MDALLDIRNVSCQKERAARFQNLNLTVNSGEIGAVYGGVNSGKTALVDLIAGFAKPKNGQIFRVAEVAVVPQQFIFYPDLTVAENLEFCAAVNDFPESRLPEIIAATNLTGWEKIRAGRLPNALKAMLQLACAMAREFDLLVLDEVTAALDTNLKQAFWKLLGRLRDAGKGILLVTGLWGDANRCDWVINLSAEEVFAREPQSVGKKAKKGAVAVNENPMVRPLETNPAPQPQDSKVGSAEVIL